MLTKDIEMVKEWWSVSYAHMRFYSGGLFFISFFPHWQTESKADAIDLLN